MRVRRRARVRVEVRGQVGLARVVCGRLVEVEVEVRIAVKGEVVLGRAACGIQGWRGGRQAEGWTYSDMNGFGPFIEPFVWFKLYWTAWAILLAALA